MIKDKEEVGLFGIDLGELSISVKRPGVWPELYTISAGQKVTALNTRTRSSLQEGQGYPHDDTIGSTSYVHM